MVDKNKNLWPDKLEWRFIDPDSTEEAKDAGFYDAEFGSMVLRVIVRLDGKFQPAFGNDYVEILHRSVFVTLDDAQRAACVLGAQLLVSGTSILWGLANTGAEQSLADFPDFLKRGELVQDKLVGGKLSAVEPLKPVPADVLQSILAIVDRNVEQIVIETWTPAEREEARAWAAAVHLSASDNDDVVVPPEPEHVKKASWVSRGGVW